MADIKYRLKYIGDEADIGRLPAHDGAQSLEGISWSITLVTNYLATGKIKSRGAMAPGIRSFIYPARRGSFVDDIFVFITEPNNLFLTSVLGSYVAATVGQIVNTVIVKTIKEACGLGSKLLDKEEQWMSRFPPGDIEALVDRVEPSLRRAHEVIDNGATKLIIHKGHTPIITFDTSTKDYVNSNNRGDEEVERKVSVGAFNANTGNGRFYLPDIGKTVPFSISKEPSQGTYRTLSYSLDRYVRGRPSYINVTCFEFLTKDGRIKKLLVSAATRVPGPGEQQSVNEADDQ